MIEQVIKIEAHLISYLTVTHQNTGPCGPSDINPYMAPLVDELEQLENGIDCFDASIGSNFKLKGRVIMGVFDNPGSSKVLKFAGPGSIINACRHCTIEGNFKIHNMYYDRGNLTMQLKTNYAMELVWYITSLV